MEQQTLSEVRALRDLVTAWREGDQRVLDVWREGNQRALELQAKAYESQLEILRVESRTLTRLVYIGVGAALAIDLLVRFIIK